jgi:hypothetical protein
MSLAAEPLLSLAVTVTSEQKLKLKVNEAKSVI